MIKALSFNLNRPTPAQSENRTPEKLWLDKNENRDPFYTGFILSLLKKISSENLFSYPDPYHLYKKLSDFFQVNIDEIFISAGSDGIIRSVFESMLSQGDCVIYPEPTFAMYEVYAKLYSGNIELLHYSASEAGPILSLNLFLERIKNKKPRLVCLPNPNSPTGTVFNEDELKTIIETSKNAGAFILIDEAYYPFYEKTAIHWINEFQNLIIARTFSKAWGLAGIRLGYAVANKELIKLLHQSRPMYEAGALSMAIAEKALDHQDEMLKSVKRLNAGKNYFCNKMHDFGFKTLCSEGNFMHVNFNQHRDRVHQALSDSVLYRKNFSHPSLAGYSRFTATTEEVFLPLVNLIKEVISE